MTNQQFLAFEQNFDLADVTLGPMQTPLSVEERKLINAAQVFGPGLETDQEIQKLRNQFRQYNQAHPNHQIVDV